ncbi:MAG: DUF6056 family protein, partial [Succinatimonas sp.]|nr:DUF6056 family protein [Succinatimonas sp.]
KIFFSIFNTFVFIILIYYILKLACVSHTDDAKNGENLVSYSYTQVKPLHILLVFAFLLLFTPEFGQDIFWITGSFNYLVPTTFLLFLFDKLVSFDKVKVSFKICLLSPLFFIGGAFFEGIGATLLAMQVLLGIKQYLTFKKVSVFYLLSFVFSVAGCLFLVLAPGNFQRLKASKELAGGDIDRVGQIIDTFFKILGWYFDVSYLLIPAIFIVLCICLKKTFFKQKSVATISIYGLLILASTFCYTVAPELPSRVQFLGTVIALILSMYFIVHLKQVFKETVTKCIKIFIAVGCIVVVAVSYRLAYRDNRLYLHSFASIDKSIEEQMSVDPSNVKLDLCLLHVSKSKFSASHLLIPSESKYNQWIFDAYFAYKNYKKVKLIDCKYNK